MSSFATRRRRISTKSNKQWNEKAATTKQGRIEQGNRLGILLVSREMAGEIPFMAQLSALVKELDDLTIASLSNR